MKTVDTLCKKLQDPDDVDTQLRFISQLFDETEEFEYEEITDEKEDKDVPKKKDKVIEDDSDENSNENCDDDDEFEEELETS